MVFGMLPLESKTDDVKVKQWDKQWDCYDTERSISRPNGEKTGRNPTGKRSQTVCADRSQRRSGEGGNENASHQTPDFRQSESGNAPDDCRSQPCDRSST